MEKFGFWGDTAIDKSAYNLIPKDFPEEQIETCKNCYYRLYLMQIDSAKDEARRKGGSVRDYMQGYYIQYEAVKECNEKNCLLETLEIEEEKARKEPSILIPKNSGLKEKSLKIIKDKNIKGKIIEVRGEDIPRIINSSNENLIGITGEDLYKEYTLENYNAKLEIIERVLWQDDKAIFKKPALCLLGKKSSSLEAIKDKTIRVGINNKYKKIAKKYLNSLELEGYNFEKSYFSGNTEEIFQLGLIDLIIDIVYSGKSAEAAGLEIYDKIFESDIVIIRRKK